MRDLVDSARIEEVLDENKREAVAIYDARSNTAPVSEFLEDRYLSPFELLDGLGPNFHPFLSLILAERLILRAWRGSHGNLANAFGMVLDANKKVIKKLKKHPDLRNPKSNGEVKVDLIKMMASSRAKEHLLEEPDTVHTGWLFEEQSLYSGIKNERLRKWIEENSVVTRMFIGSCEDMELIAKIYWGVDRPFSTGRIEGTREELIRKYGNIPPRNGGFLHNLLFGKGTKYPGSVQDQKILTWA